MSTNRNTGSNLSKDELLDILNDIDSERQQNRINTSDRQSKNSSKSKATPKLRCNT